MTERPTYDALDDALKAKVDAMVAELAIQPAEYHDAIRYLFAMVAVRAGLLRLVERGAREGQPGVVLVDERQEALYWVADPALGETAEAEIVGCLADALGIAS